VKEVSINLLPEEKVKLLHIERLNAVSTVVTSIVGVTLAGVIVVLLVLIGGVSAGRAALNSEISKSNSQIAKLNHLDDTPMKLEDEAKILQSQLKTIKTILATKEQVQFGAALVRLGKIVPPDVSFSQASIDATHVVTIVGKAKTFAAIGRFAEALNEDGTTLNRPGSGPQKYFSKVDITSSSFDQASGAVQYSLSFTLGEETFNAGN
jgi:hypothetical protein